MRGTRLGILAIALAAAVGLLWWLTRPEAPRDRAEREAPAGAVEAGPAPAFNEARGAAGDEGEDESAEESEDAHDTAFVAGIVVDRDGHPIEGARVFQSPFSSRATETGTHGTFRLELDLEKSELFWVVAPGFASADVRCNPWQTDLRVVMERSATVTVTVRMPNGSPAAGATVDHLTCDDAGACVFEDLAPGILELHASLGEHVGTAWLRVESGGRHEVTIELTPRDTSFLRILVLDVDGAPLSGRKCSWRAGRESGFVRTDRRGEVTEPLTLRAGTDVDVTVAGATAGTVTRAGEDHDPDVVRLPPAEHFWVIARGPDGEPLPADVEATFQGLGGLVPIEKLRDRARFRFDPRQPIVSLAVAAPGFARFSRFGWPTPEPGAEVEIRLERGVRVRGRVVRADDGAVAGVHVSATAVSPRWPHEAYTDARGAFEIRDVPPGEIDVYATAGDAPAERLGRFTATGAELDLGTRTLPAAAHVSGLVTDPAGRPLGGAAVATQVEDEESEPVFTRSDGRFRLAISSSRKTFLLVSRPGSGTRSSPAQSAGTTPIVLAPGARLAVRVRYDPYSVSGSFTYSVRDPATGSAWSPTRLELTSARAETRWIYDDLAPGPLQVLAYAGGEPKVADVDVRADGTSEVTIDLGDG